MLSSKFEAKTPTLRFGRFTLDIPARALRYGARTVTMTAKEFDLLVILVQKHGRLVSKGDLVEQRWSDAMSDAAIFQAVYRLRRTLARYDRRNEYVATVPGRGYQFVAFVAMEEDEASPYDVSGSAFAAYSRAMFQFQHRTKESFSAAIVLFRRAIRLDPQFALAYVGLAHSHFCAGIERFEERESSRERALAACRTAIKIDPRCADAYAVLSEIYAFFDADVDRAQRTIEKALSLDRNSWRVRTAAFWAFLTANDVDRALREVSEALAVDPSSNHFTTLLGVGLYYKRHFDAAHARLIDAHLFKPADSMALFYDACALCCLGDYSGAQKRLAQRASLDRNVRADALEVYIEARRGKRDQARRLLEILWSRTPLDDVGIALALTAVGQLSQAADHACTAITSKQVGCYLIRLDPLLEPLRDYIWLRAP